MPSYIHSPTTSRPISRIHAQRGESRLQDTVVVEEPLEIRLESQTLTITMRTPGDDLALTAGFLLSEGIIRSADDFCELRHCEASSNIVRVTLSPGVFFASTGLQRNFFASASCGLCGKATVDALAIRCAPLQKETQKLDSALICPLPSTVRAKQSLFTTTGGTHAAALFNENGDMVSIAEDVGRHNAVDKVIGQRVLAKKSHSPCPILFISGRASFEIVQKAIAARIPTLVAVGAPSSLAIETAQRFSLTLVGFTGDQSFNVYT